MGEQVELTEMEHKLLEIYRVWYNLAKDDKFITDPVSYALYMTLNWYDSMRRINQCR